MQTDQTISAEWFAVNAPDWQLIMRESYTNMFYFLYKVEDPYKGVIWFDEDYASVLVKIKADDIPRHIIMHLRTQGLNID